MPDLSAFGTLTPAQRYELRAEYFDTPAFDLTRAGWSLRRRSGGHDAGWHLKSPLSADVRIEQGLPLSPTLPPEFRALAKPLLGSRPLLSVAFISTIRDESDLLGADGHERAKVASDLVTATVGSTTSTWREVEVELAHGEPLSTLEAIEDELLVTGYIRSHYRSKIAQSLAEVASSPAPALDRQAAAGRVILAYAGKQVGTLQNLQADVLVDAPDAVHKSRVATRRLRSLLKTYRPLFDAERAAMLEEELRWYGEILGAPRDAEVLKEHLLQAVAELASDEVHGPVIEHLTERLDSRHADAHRQLVETMGEERYDALTWQLIALLVDEPFTDDGRRRAEEVVGPLVREAVERTRRRFDRALAKPQKLVRWHEARKAAKAVRYCLEALNGAFGEDAKTAATRWTAVTEALGAAQDTVISWDALDEAAAVASLAGEPTDTYRRLQERQLEKRKAALAEGSDALEAALTLDLSWLD